MATVKSNASCNPSSLSVSKKSKPSGTISWSKPAVPEGATISSCVLTGTPSISNNKISAKINDAQVASGTKFSINLGTSNTTTSVPVTTSVTSNASGTVSFSDLVYTVTYEVPLVLESISLNNTSITVEKNKTKTITVIPNPSEYLLSDLQWSINNNNCKIYPNPAGYDESTNQQTSYGLNCEILGYEVGTSTVTVTTSDGAKSASCTVTVVESTNDDIEIIWDHGHVFSETGEIVLMINDEFIYTNMIHVDPINEYYVTITNQKGAYLAGYSYDSNCNYIGRLAQSNGDYFVDDAVNEAINLPDNASYIRFRVTCGADESHGSLIESQDKITINVNIRHTVIFKDWDGTTLKTEIVEESASATAPSNPAREGYNFIGWDKDFTNVQSDLTVTAQYEKIPESPEEPDDNELVQGDINEDGSFNDGVSTVVRTKYIDISDKKSIVVNVLTDDVYISACYLYNANKELVKVIEIPAGKKRMFGVNLQELIAQILNDEGGDQ